MEPLSSLSTRVLKVQESFLDELQSMFSDICLTHIMISAHASHILPLSLSDSAPRPSMAYTVKWNVSRNTPTLLKDRSDRHAFEIRSPVAVIRLIIDLPHMDKNGDHE